MALTFTPTDGLGDKLPPFRLKAVDGKFYSDKDFDTKSPLLIMFICNHCPYVKAIEDRLIQLALDLKKLDIATVAVCSNDANEYPEDNFENLQKRWTEKKYPFPYLHDESQAVAKSFGAVCTPDFFLYDQNRKLAYRGRLDDSWRDASKVTRRELYSAALALAKSQPLMTPQTPSMGCNIKWSDQ